MDILRAENERFISSFSTLCRKKNFLDHLKLCYTMAFSILKNKGGSYNSKSLRQISCHPHFFGEVENWVEVLPKLYSTSTCFVAYIQLSTCRRNTPIYSSLLAFGTVENCCCYTQWAKKSFEVYFTLKNHQKWQKNEEKPCSTCLQLISPQYTAHYV